MPHSSFRKLNQWSKFEGPILYIRGKLVCSEHIDHSRSDRIKSMLVPLGQLVCPALVCASGSKLVGGRDMEDFAVLITWELVDGRFFAVGL